MLKIRAATGEEGMRLLNAVGTGFEDIDDRGVRDAAVLAVDADPETKSVRPPPKPSPKPPGTIRSTTVSVSSPGRAGRTTGVLRSGRLRRGVMRCLLSGFG
jgi:hypothetical protein